MFNELYGEIDFRRSSARKAETTPVKLPSGSVYGIFAYPDNKAAGKALLEATHCEASEVEPIDGGAYPLYWGRDIHPGSRVMAHARVRNGNTGNAKLEQIPALQKCKVLFKVSQFTKILS
ncbi:hypothetical protein JQX13_06040 [Archangium violaceum]|uniref:hypothetical protein n=1 Tax=Archangium violaceum TaxID=83451 RepID=UPI00193B841C|nr:hypothetical protein [Archangium violaceum]QRK09687.1 hypothetical protein JQX13_06040 [Archangium violaceum]